MKNSSRTTKRCDELAEMIPFLDSAINKWLVEHEEMEEEMGIISPQEELAHEDRADDEEESELIQHMR